MTQEAPRIESFRGREQELKEVLQALEDSRLVVVTGLAGMGKTTLAAKVCDRYRDRRSLFWRRVRPWDTAEDLARSLAKFLKAIGRSGLLDYLGMAGRKELGPLEELISGDLAGAAPVLIFDDLHLASPNAEAFFSILLAATKTQKDVSVLCISRQVPRFYTRKDVDADRTVAELPLKGLDNQACRAILAEAGVPGVQIAGLAKLSCGSPLFLKILARSARGSEAGDDSAALYTYIGEEIEPSLTRSELACIEIASLYFVPVPSRALLLEKRRDPRTLRALQRKGLLDRLPSGRFVVHDSLRDYFRETTRSERQEALAPKVVGWLEEESNALARKSDWPGAIATLENAVRIEPESARRANLFHRLGHFRDACGDVPGALEAFRKALEDSVDEALRGELHAHVAGCLDTLADWRAAEEELKAGFRERPSKPSLGDVYLLQARAMINFHSRPNYAEALADVDRALELLTRLPRNDGKRASLLFFRGSILIATERPTDAIPVLGEAIEACKHLDNSWQLAWLYVNMAIACVETGQSERAREWIGKTTTLARKLGDDASSTWHFARGWYLSECEGAYADAEVAYGESYRLAKKRHDRVRVLWHFKHSADSFRHQGRVQEAIESLAYFVRTSRGVINDNRRFENLCLLTRLLIEKGDTETALEHLREAEGLAVEETALSTYDLEWAWASLRASRGELDEAAANFQRAWQAPLQRAPRNHGEEVLATPTHKGELLLDYGRFLLKQGDTAGAGRILSRAFKELESHCLHPLAHQAARLLQSLDVSLPALVGHRTG